MGQEEGISIRARGGGGDKGALLVPVVKKGGVEDRVLAGGGKSRHYLTGKVG